MALIPPDSSHRWMTEKIEAWLREEAEARLYTRFINAFPNQPLRMKAKDFDPDTFVITHDYYSNKVLLRPKEIPMTPQQQAFNELTGSHDHRRYLGQTMFRRPALYNSTLARFRQYVNDMVSFSDRPEGLDYHQLAMDVGEFLFPDRFEDKTKQWARESDPQPTKQTEQSLMKGYKFEQKHYMNGQCIEDMSDDEIVACVAGIKADKERLEKLGIESKAINKQITAMGEAMTEMIEHLDGRVKED